MNKFTQSMILLISFMPVFLCAQDFSKVKISASKAAGDVYILTGAGGNIGVLATKSGLLLVDDQFQPLAEKIETAMKSLVNSELKYIVNTHYHGDHTGSNSYFSHKAPIFAHQNVRIRLQGKKEHQPEGLPVVTYKDGVKIYLDNEEIQITHLPSGHTDGDSIVYFKRANVLHTGDLFFQGRFPYIDLAGGGTVKGYLANVNHMINSTPADVVIIPGHGDLTNKAELKRFSAMLKYSIERIETALSVGKSEKEIIAMGIGKQYKNLAWTFISEEFWLKTLIQDLK